MTLIHPPAPIPASCNIREGRYRYMDDLLALEATATGHGPAPFAPATPLRPAAWQKYLARRPDQRFTTFGGSSFGDSWAGRGGRPPMGSVVATQAMARRKAQVRCNFPWLGATCLPRRSSCICPISICQRVWQLRSNPPLSCRL